MILLHRSLKRSEDYMRSMKRLFEVNCKTIDGVIETFNNKNGQGFMLKIFCSYKPENDLAVWFYESADRKIKIAYSTRSNVDEFNSWKEPEKVNFQVYPIVKDIKREVIADILKIIKSYYNLDEEIEMPKSISI